MEGIREARQLETVPRPCDVFDFIGGTSTGGIIAIMLGRLGLSVDDCIRAYRKVASKAFTPKRTSILPASPKGAFSAKALEAAIKETVQSSCEDPGCAEACTHGEAEFRDATCTRTGILAITKENVDAPATLLTTYDTSAQFRGCRIWQVARATSAATTFFKPIKLGRDDIEFVDAGFGYNNPCEVLIEEAKRQFPDRRHLHVLSIGTGLGDVVTIGNSRLAIINALKKMATSSKQVHARLQDRYQDDGQYYRFNVERGLEDVVLSDWEKASKISAHTQNYIQENRRAIRQYVDSLCDLLYRPIPAIDDHSARGPADQQSATSQNQPSIVRNSALQSAEQSNTIMRARDTGATIADNVASGGSRQNNSIYM